MATGFGIRTESQEKYIRNYFRQSRKILRGCETLEQAIEGQRREWYEDYSQRKHEYSLEALLNPEYHELCIDTSPSFRQARESHKSLEVLVMAHKGLWGLMINWDNERRIYDMTITVNTGGGMCFHPDAIQGRITNMYGSLIYKQWKSLVLDDLGSLSHLIDAVRKEITYVVPSLTCCERSERLCKRVGLPVRHGIAFLFPEYYA